MSKLKNIRLGFGETKDSPITITAEQIAMLIRIIEDGSITDKSFSGYITSADGIKGSVAWTLGRYGLSYVGKTMVDSYTISSETTSVVEGSTAIVVAEGLPTESLAYEVETVTVKSGGVDADYVSALCTMEGNVLRVGKGSNINGWVAEVTVKATPRFDSPAVARVKFTVNGRILPTSISIDGYSIVKLGEETVVDYTFRVLPATSNVPLEGLNVVCDSNYVEVKNVTQAGFQLVVPAVDFSFNVEVTAMSEGTSLRAEKQISTQLVQMHAGHEYVDLDLPSGRLWATTNIGADTEKDDGLYFQWGATTGHKSGEGYNFASGNYPQSGISSNLSDAQDAARAIWGGDWRMPSKEDFAELAANCYMERVTNYNGTGVAGLIFYSCKDNATGKGLYNSAGTWYAWGGSYYNSSTSKPANFVPYTLNTPHVFFPASGYYHGTSLNGRGSLGFCWSRSYYSSSNAYYLNFSSSGVLPQSYYYRYYGFSVRPCL